MLNSHPKKCLCYVVVVPCNCTLMLLIVFITSQVPNSVYTLSTELKRGSCILDSLIPFYEPNFTNDKIS